jgi:hypothetical protein
MGQTFPANIPNYPDTQGGETLHNAGAGKGLSQILDDYGLDLIQVATKIGSGASTSVDNAFMVGNGVGTTSWESASTAKTSIGLGNVDNTSDATKNSASVTLTNKTISTGSVIDTNVTVTEVLKKVYPVGAIYIAVVSTSPATLFGFGTWAVFGAGKTLVSLNSADTDFDTVEEVGGYKEITLTHQQSGLPAHTHTGSTNNVPPTQTAGKIAVGNASAVDIYTTNANTAVNASAAHSNLQPYIVAYMWKRTA